MNKTLSIKAKIAAIVALALPVAVPAVVVGVSVAAAPAAHAAGELPNGNWTMPTADYEYGDPVSNGARTGMSDFGSQTDQRIAAVDYGQINNIFLTRGASAVGAWAVAGSVLAAMIGCTGFVMSKLRGGLSH